MLFVIGFHGDHHTHTHVLMCFLRDQRLEADPNKVRDPLTSVIQRHNTWRFATRKMQDLNSVGSMVVSEPDSQPTGYGV